VAWDFWKVDADVEHWLVRLAWAREGHIPTFEQGALLSAARASRMHLVVL
jgi:hypothetical protein